MQTAYTLSQIAKIVGAATGAPPEYCHGQIKRWGNYLGPFFKGAGRTSPKKYTAEAHYRAAIFSTLSRLGLSGDALAAQLVDPDGNLTVSTELWDAAKAGAAVKLHLAFDGGEFMAAALSHQPYTGIAEVVVTVDLGSIFRSVGAAITEDVRDDLNALSSRHDANLRNLQTEDQDDA